MGHSAEWRGRQENKDLIFSGRVERWWRTSDGEMKWMDRLFLSPLSSQLRQPPTKRQGPDNVNDDNSYNNYIFHRQMQHSASIVAFFFY